MSTPHPRTPDCRAVAVWRRLAREGVSLATLAHVWRFSPSTVALHVKSRRAA